MNNNSELLKVLMHSLKPKDLVFFTLIIGVYELIGAVIMVVNNLFIGLCVQVVTVFLTLICITAVYSHDERVQWGENK